MQKSLRGTGAEENDEAGYRKVAGRWQWLDECTEPSTVSYLTIGWLLKETEGTLLVAQNLGDITSERKQFSGGTEIVRRQIVQLQEVTCPSCLKGVTSDGQALG
ncbi:MAG: hypothetical protein LBI31_06400 [Zoogloeaceae bacterium]|jgi:hypothetical protein|nr:hypothetical protein [Zoogloeaceae bacterium]